MNAELNDTLAVARVLKPYSFSLPFWDATREKKLLIQYCRASGRYQHPVRPTSIYTGRRSDLEWREVSGRGTLYSWTIADRGPPAFRGHEPYAVASVMLEEGALFIANLVHCSRDALLEGMKLVPSWHPLGDGRHLPMFQPA